MVLKARTLTLEDVIAGIEGAVRADDPEASAKAVMRVLSEAVRSGDDFLPVEFTRPSEASYARRVVHSSSSGLFTLMAMVWQGTQATPLHDHDGKWVVECVYRGRVHVTNYQCTGSHDDLYQFEIESTAYGVPGECEYRIPPFEHHVLRNAHPEPTVTLHVFGGAMTHCSIFEPATGGYRKIDKQLAVTP